MSYNIINDYGDFAQGEAVSSVSVSAYWVVAVFPLVYPATFKRAENESFSKHYKDAVMVEKPLILFDSVQSVQVSHNKGQHVGSMSMVLYPTSEFLSIINPGDYIFCWMVNSEAKFASIIDRLKNKQSVNEFDDGLKFYGKINAVREQITQQPDGLRMGRYMVNAHSFSELDATFFYEMHLATLPGGVATQIEHLNLDLDAFISDSDEDGIGVVPNKMIVSLIDIYLGKGVKKNLGSNATDLELQSTFGTAGDYAHILPEDVGIVLGKTLKSEVILKTADTLEVVHGIMNFTDTTNSIDPKDFKTVASSFAPNNTTEPNSRRFTGKDLVGRNSPIVPNLSSQSLWSVCTNYLNNSCNEMYTTLRCNPEGKVVPTIMIRQMPFSTDLAIANNVTKFSEVPRWVIPSVIVKSADVGRSDAMRFNFVHIYGTNDSKDARNITQQMIDAPPRTDSLDIARSGLRPFMMTVPCSSNQTRDPNGPKLWMDIVGDFIMGQHMTLTGSLTTIGIQSPICVGDNLVWDNVLYHIEGVTHACQIAPDGQKGFQTTLSLTHGMSLNQLKPLSKTSDTLSPMFSGYSGYDPDFTPTIAPEPDVSPSDVRTTDISLYARVSSANESAYLPKVNLESKTEETQSESTQKDRDQDFLDNLTKA